MWSCSPGPQPALINAATLSPDDRLFVALGDEGDVVVRDLAAQSSSKPDIKFLEPGPFCAFSPDGKLFAMASYLGYARVWETANWREAATLRGFKLGVVVGGFLAGRQSAGHQLRVPGSRRSIFGMWPVGRMSLP